MKNASTTLKLILMFDPKNEPHKVFMDNKMHNLKMLLLDRFPKLSDTQVRKINRISDDVCSCSIHISNYNVASMARFVSMLTTDVQNLTMLRVLEWTVIGEN